MGRRLPGATPAEKLRLNVFADGECLRWTGAHTPKGYGQLQVNGRRVSVHRLAYELHKGPIPAGHEPDHLCQVRDCVRPEHLEAVTHRENVRRTIRRLENREPGEPKAVCTEGHRMAEDNLQVIKRANGRTVFRCRRCHNARNRIWRERSRESAYDA